MNNTRTVTVELKLEVVVEIDDSLSTSEVVKQISEQVREKLLSVSKQETFSEGGYEVSSCLPSGFVVLDSFKNGSD